MDDGTEGRFDDEIARAWSEFEEGLTFLLRDVRKGDAMTLRSRGGDDLAAETPYVKVAGLGPGRVRATVSSNSSLHPRYSLTAAQEDELRRQGWKEPWTGSNGADFASMTTAKQYVRIASMVGAAIRTVLGVHHPALIRVEGLSNVGLGLLRIGVPPVGQPAAPELDPMRPAGGPSAGIDELPDELVQLVAMAGVVQIGADAAVRICRNDVSLMASLAALAEQRAQICRRWARQYREEGDDCSALDLEIEADRLRTALRALRAAMRLAR